MEPNDKSWLRTPLTESNDIIRHYDEWVSTYNRELVGWGYVAPGLAAHRLVKVVPPWSAALVLDVGCGTGLTGLALRSEGFDNLVGMDISALSLQEAERTGVYERTVEHDFNAAPLPFPAAAFSGALCVGVMSYAADPLSLISEIARVVRPGGAFVFTHRTDLWDRGNLPEVLDRHLRDHPGSVATWSDPMPYMPGNPDFTDTILVRYVTVVVA